MISPRFLIYLIVIGIGLLYGLIHFSKLRLHFKILTFFLALVFSSEVLSRVIGMQMNSSMPVYHFFIPLELIMLGLFYWLAFKKSYRLILIIALTGCVASVTNSFLLQSITEFPTYSYLFLLLFVISLSMIHLLKSATQPTIFRFSQIPVFWVNVAGLLFFSTTLFFFGFKNIFNFENEIYGWIVYGITISTYLLYFYSIVLEKRNEL